MSKDNDKINIMKIGLFTDTYHPQINGVVTSIDSFKYEFEKMGHSVYVFAPKLNGIQSTSTVWRFRSVPYPFHNEHRLVWPLSRQLSSFSDLNLDIIHAQTPFAMGFLASRLAKKYGLPLVHSFHTHFEEYCHYVPFAPKKVVKRFAVYQSQKTCNDADLIITPSQAMKDKLLSYKVTQPIDIIPTGIRLDRPPVLANAIHDFRQCYGISSDDIVLTFIGRLGLEKNIFFLLDCFHQIYDCYPNVKLLIIGDGPQRQLLKDRVNELNLTKHVVFTGYLDHDSVFVGLSLSTACLFPSKTETQGLILLEAMSMGVPVICIRSMSVDEVLCNNNGGFLTDDSISAYSKIVIDLISNPALLKAKQSEALLRARDYSSVGLAHRMIALYQNLIR